MMAGTVTVRRPRVRGLEERFESRIAKAYPNAVDRLCRDWERLVAFYNFPKDHWGRLRTSNPACLC
jgi:transposase-like protein